VPGKATIDLQAGKIALAVAKDKMRPGESIEIRAANAVAGIRGNRGRRGGLERRGPSRAAPSGPTGRSGS